MPADLTPERWRRLSALLEEALELPADRRGPLLAAAHSEDAEMGRLAAEMLKAAEFAESPMEGLPFDAAGSVLREIAGEAEDAAAPDAAGPHARAGESFGAYRLERKIGEGGMGEVWLAEQSGPLSRRVALKIIKAGFQSRHVIARFEAERQALALMEHQAIARVFDAGVTPWGFPYFVMEYVQGETITGYCDRHRLSIEARLSLFAQVCDGVQHAHQKGIIHRDIKPSNVLVSGEPGKPVTKIIDFGLAKATQRMPADESALTQSGMLLGTPEYMSPEQARMGGLDVDTRTDVYALGVLLYELLTGVRPLDLKEIFSAGFDEVRQHILATDPLRPSARLEKLGENASSVVTHRGCTDVPTLKRRLAGDLDWITMKSLEKERALRYASAAALAEDVERHLADEPVWAGPPSARYRARKFVRRHKLGVGIATATLAFLLVLAAATTWQASRIARERDRANREARTATHALEFLTGLFEGSDPNQLKGSTLTVREVLDRGAKQIETSLAGEPEAQGQMMYTLGIVYRRLGLYEPAALLLGKSLSLRRKVLGSDHPDTLTSLDDLGLAEFWQGRHDAALKDVREALEGRRRILGENHPDTFISLNNLGMILQGDGKYDEAEVCFKEALEGRRRVLGPRHRDTLTSAGNLGSLYSAQGKLEQAEPLIREAMEGTRQVLGADHPDSLTILGQLGLLLQSEGKLAEGETRLREALEGERRVHGENHEDTLLALNNVGLILHIQGKLHEAEPFYREALEGERRNLGIDHPVTLNSMNNLCQLLVGEGKLGEAAPLCREALERCPKALGTEHVFALNALYAMAMLLHAQGKLSEAEIDFHSCYETRRRVLGEDAPPTLSAMAGLGDVYTSQGRLPEAGALLEDALARARKSNQPNNRTTGRVLNHYGRYLLRMRKYAEAEKVLLEAHQILSASDAGLAPVAARRLAELYKTWGNPEKAAEWRAEAASR